MHALYDFHARQYDAQIGRFWGIDPADQFPSGYTGMGNDPASGVDPTGMITFGAFNSNQVQIASIRSYTGEFGDGGWSMDGEGNIVNEFGGGGVGVPSQTEDYSNVDNASANGNEAFEEDPGNGEKNASKKGNQKSDQKKDPKAKEEEKEEEKEGEKKDEQLGYKPAPKNGLPAFPEAGKGAYNKQSRRWRWVLPNGEILEWDKQHGELEWYHRNGAHKGVLDPETGRERLEKKDKTRRAKFTSMFIIYYMKSRIQTNVDQLNDVNWNEVGKRTFQLGLMFMRTPYGPVTR